MSADPSLRTTVRVCAPISPGISPMMRSISDSKVTIPAVPPYSSITSASRALRRRISASRSLAPSVTGTVSTSRASAPAVDLGVAAAERLHQLDDVQHADHVVEVLAVDRQPRRLAAADLRQQVAQPRVGVDGDQLGARNHHLAGGQIGEAEHAVQHLFFLLLEHPRFLARGHQHLQLFFRVDHPAVIAAAQPQHPHHALRRAVHQPDERPEHAHEQLERFDQPDRRRLRPLERDPFRRQLAEHDLQRR